MARTSLWKAALQTGSDQEDYVPLILALMLMLGVLSPNARPGSTPLAPELKRLFDK